MSFLFRNKTEMPEAADALPGRDTRPFDVPEKHAYALEVNAEFFVGLGTAERTAA